MRHHYRIHGQLDRARASDATVTVDQHLFSVRPLRSMQVYTLPLADVAAIVVARLARAAADELRRGRRAEAARG